MHGTFAPTRKAQKPDIASDVPQDPNKPVDIQVYCTDGAKPLHVSNVVPAKMLCSYQNPHCIGFPTSIQC